jgi:hypothetical protein
MAMAITGAACGTRVGGGERGSWDRVLPASGLVRDLATVDRFE